MRTVLRNTDEAAHVWAAQTQQHGKAGNVYFEGPTIYSYGNHFPIAKVYTLDTGERIALFNSRTYSNSTAKHQRAARSAWQGNGEALRAHQELWPRDAWNADARQWQPEPLTRAQLDDITAKQAELDTASNEAAKQAKREQARRNRERAKERKAYDALMLISYPERLSQWKAGTFHAHQMPEFYNHAHPVELRYIDGGKRIETSRRAVVPTRAALALWNRYTAGDNIAAEPCGPYTVNETNAETVRIGCHMLQVQTLREFFSTPPQGTPPDAEA